MVGAFSCADATQIVRANQPPTLGQEISRSGWLLLGEMPVPFSHPMMIVEASMRNALIALMVLTLLGGIQGLALAQQEAKQDQPATEPQTIEVTVYYAVVVDKDAKDVRIGPDRRTQAEAEQDVKRWDNEHPKSLLLAVVREKTRKTPVSKLKDAKEAADKVKDAKEAVDKAKEIQEKGPEERKLGDTLKEYTDRIKDTYENVKNLKSNMLSMTGKISRKQFDDANKLIARYNKSRDELGKVEKQFSTARSDRFKAAPLPGSSGGVRKGGTPPQANVSVLDKFPAMAPLDPNDFMDKLEPEKPAGKWVVWVYKNVGGKWEKREDQSFSSDDQEAAEKYFKKAKELDGFTATTNLPPSAKPESTGKFAGTTWAGELFFFGRHGPDFDPNHFHWEFFPNTTFLITLGGDGTCYVLLGDDDKSDVVRKESKWSGTEDGFIVDELQRYKNVKFHVQECKTGLTGFDTHTHDALSDVVFISRDTSMRDRDPDGEPEPFRFFLNKGYGLVLEEIMGRPKWLTTRWLKEAKYSSAKN
jgi:hypothetical protein